METTTRTSTLVWMHLSLAWLLGYGVLRLQSAELQLAVVVQTLLLATVCVEHLLQHRHVR